MEPLFQIRPLILVSIFCSLLIIGAFVCTLNGQIIDRQSFTQSSGFPLMKPPYMIQLDWQLDLGITSIALNQSPNHFYTAGFIQPNIYRHQQIDKPSDFDPAILIRYNEKSESIILSSKESDLIIYGFQVFNFAGARILSIKTTTSSSHLFLSTSISKFPSGVYFIQVYYLPENISSDFQFWIKTQKIVKQ